MRPMVLRLTGAAIGIATIFAIAHFFGLNKNALFLLLQAQEIGPVLITAAFFTANLFINAVAFNLLLSSQYDTADRKQTIIAYGLSALAKYIPGGIWQIAGRSITFGRIGVPGRKVIWASILEQGISLFLCLFFGCAFLFPRIWEVLLLLALMASLRVPFVTRFGWRIESLSNSWQSIDKPRLALSIAFYLLALATYVAGYWVLAREISETSAPQFAGSLLLGTAVGFLAIFIPSGLGVREGVTTALNGGVMSADVVALLILARAISLISEIFVFLFCLLFFIRGRNPR